MPKIEQLNWDKLTPKPKEKSQHLKKPENIYWRYKKPTSPESTSDKHSPIITSFFTCSKCKQNLETRQQLKDHYFAEHD